MKKIMIGILLWSVVHVLYAGNTITIGKTMYQKQKFDYRKSVLVFEADKEGERVWNWNHAQRYCQNLRLDGYRDWKVASRAELEKIMSKHRGYNGLYVKKIYGQYLPEPDPKYFDVWMWTRESKRPNLGGFVNFKKGKTGWADKKYKGYVICTRSAGKSLKSKGGIAKSAKPFLFVYQKNVWRSDMTKRGTRPLGDYKLLYFYCQNGLDPAIPSASRLISYKNRTYFFAYANSAKNKKNLNLYRTNGTKNGTRKIGNIGRQVAYSPIWVGSKLYFLSSAYLPQQADPMKEKLWVLDTKIKRLKYVGNTATESKGNIYPFAKSRNKLFFKHVPHDKNKSIWVTDKKRGLVKIKNLQNASDNLKSIKVAGKNRILNPLNILPWGCDGMNGKGSFKIVKKSLWYNNVKIKNLSETKGLKVHDLKLVYHSKKYAIVSSNGKLWGVDTKGKMERLK